MMKEVLKEMLKIIMKEMRATIGQRRAVTGARLGYTLLLPRCLGVRGALRLPPRCVLEPRRSGRRPGAVGQSLGLAFPLAALIGAWRLVMGDSSLVPPL